MKGSVELQYRIQLSLEGLVEDLAHPPLPLAARLSALERYRLFWNHLLFSPDCIRVIYAPSATSSMQPNCFPIGRWLVDNGDVNHPRVSALPPPDSGKLAWKDISSMDAAPQSRKMLSAVALRSLDMLILLSEDGRCDAQSRCHRRRV